MITQARSVRLSAIDEQRFGVRTARAEEVDQDSLPRILKACEEQGVALLIARCSVDKINAAQAMESAGFRLMDTLVYYECSLAEASRGQSSVAGVRPMRAGEEGQVEAIAQATFRGYVGHYHADPRLDPTLCDQTYASWARRCCKSSEAADVVLVTPVDGRIAGFVAIQVRLPDLGQLVLGAVAPNAQGRGLYGALAVGGMEWCRARGVQRFVSSTQINNFAAQKSWVGVGMTLTRAVYTFHKWFA